MAARIHCASALAEGASLTLPPEAARHVQVLRLQPGDALTVFNGDGGEWAAEVTHMGRQAVGIAVLAHRPTNCELPWRVTLALGMPANERMDALVEKATELGAWEIVPLQSARSVLKLSGERAERRQAHWQAVAVAAAEQSGRTVVPAVAPVQTLAAWLPSLGGPGLAPSETSARYLLSFAADALPVSALAAQARPHLLLLSGPEGGLDGAEEAAARSQGFLPLSLGPRVLRADTAPLAALAALAALGCLAP
jgi:16S rRNA (uracil1498-N3)-methyltransferase